MEYRHTICCGLSSGQLSDKYPEKISLICPHTSKSLPSWAVISKANQTILKTKFLWIWVATKIGERCEGEPFCTFLNWYLHESHWAFGSTPCVQFTLHYRPRFGKVRLRACCIQKSKVLQPLAPTSNTGKPWMTSVEKSRPELFSTVKATSCKERSQLVSCITSTTDTGLAEPWHRMPYLNALCWRCPHLKELLNFNWHRPTKTDWMSFFSRGTVPTLLPKFSSFCMAQHFLAFAKIKRTQNMKWASSVSGDSFKVIFAKTFLSPV